MLVKKRLNAHNFAPFAPVTVRMFPDIALTDLDRSSSLESVHNSYLKTCVRLMSIRSVSVRLGNIDYVVAMYLFGDVTESFKRTTYHISYALNRMRYCVPRV